MGAAVATRRRRSYRSLGLLILIGIVCLLMLLLQSRPKPEQTARRVGDGLAERADPAVNRGGGDVVSEATPSPKQDPASPPAEKYLPENDINNILLRTSWNEKRIQAWVEEGLLSSELAEILHGRERRHDVLRRNLGDLLALIQNEKVDRLLRRYAIAALILYGDESAFNTLLTLAAGRSEDWMREASFYALAEWLPQRAAVADLLFKEMATESSELRGHAMMLLVKRDVLIPQEMLLTVVDEHPWFVVQTLASQRGAEALPYLDYIAGNGSDDALKKHARETADKVRSGELRVSHPLDDPEQPALRRKTTITSGGVVLQR